VPAAYEALLRAVQMANTAPRGPTYINLDAALQETKIGPLPPLPEVSRFQPAAPVRPDEASIAKAAQLLSSAKNPAMLIGRVSRSEAAWKARVALAEKVQAKVFTDMKAACAFPTDHPLHAAPPATFPDGKLLRECDVIVSFDWIDTAGTLKVAWGDAPVSAKIIRVSTDAHVHRGWSADYQGLPPADVYLMCEPDVAVPLLLEAVRTRPAVVQTKSEAQAEKDEALSLRALARAFNEVTAGMDICLSKLPLGWNGAYRHFRHPLDYLGADGGGGVGAGPGLTVGSALALKGSGRMVVGIVGDGDFLMGNTAIWTAAHYKLACLVIVANNRSFYNDELHQERVAKERGRPVENKWIGQRIDEPDIDIAAMGRAQGAVGIGPVKQLSELKPALEQAIKHVKGGAVCVMDVRVLPGYDSNMSGTPSAAARR
jgi:thiamine pyrophosphate-dependent acetolactate synthase large subunit-like protein